MRREVGDALRLQGRQDQHRPVRQGRDRHGDRLGDARRGDRATSSSRKAIRRGLSLKIFDWGKVEPAGGSTFRQRIGLRQGLPEDLAKKISKLIRDEFPKVNGQIQGDAVRVNGKSKDELQAVIARLREEGEGYPVALQFKNYR